MKLCVLGGSGLVGSSVIKQKGKEIDTISTYKNEEIDLPYVTSIRINLPDDMNNLQKFLEDEKPNVIVNTIAHSNVDFCEKHQTEAYQINVEITRKICVLSSRLNARLIHLSTDYVFDGNKGLYSESDKPNPINYYGLTKELSERIVLQNSKNSVLRTSLVYGANPKVRFFNYVLDSLRRKQEIFAYHDTFSCPTLANELVDSIIKIAKHDISGLFHITGSSCVTRFEFAKTIANLFNEDEKLVKPSKADESKLPAKRPKNTCLDNTKATKILGINYSTIEEGINKVFHQLSDNFSKQ